MQLNHEYWCEPECTWQTNGINKTATSERLDSWASRLWRGIELVFKSLDCFTERPIFSTRPITRIKSFSLLGGGGGGSCSAPMHLLFGAGIPISRPPRVIRRFKRCSCFMFRHPSDVINTKYMRTTGDSPGEPSQHHLVLHPICKTPSCLVYGYRLIPCKLVSHLHMYHWETQFFNHMEDYWPPVAQTLMW